MLWVLALSVAGSLLIAPIAAAQTNLALGRPYTFNIAPNFNQASMVGDSTDLTDGVNWPVTSDESRLVEWNSRSSTPVISVTIDLGSSQLIGGLSLGGQFYPAFIDTWVSDDNVNFRYAGELMSQASLQTPFPELGGDALRGSPSLVGRTDIRADNLRLQGRYVKFSTYRSSSFLFLDEAKVFQGTQSPGTGSLSLNLNIENWSYINKRGAIARVRMLNDLQELSHNSLASSGSFSTQISTLRQQVMDADRLTQLTFNPTQGVPYTPLHQQIWSLNGQMNKAAGQADHAISSASRYEPLHPLDTVVNNTSPVDFQMASGETRSRAFNLSNNTSSARTAEVVLDLGGASIPTDSISLRTVRFTEAQQHVIVGSALVPAQRLDSNRWQVTLPAGATSQLWLDVDSSKLRWGDYDLSLRVTPQDAGSMAIPVNLNVHRGRVDKGLETMGFDNLSVGDGTQPSSNLNRVAMQGTLKQYGMRSHWIGPTALASDVRFVTRAADGSFASHPNFANFKGWLTELSSHPQGTDNYYPFLATDVVGESYYSGGIPTTDPRYETAVKSFFIELAKDIDARGLDRSKFVFTPLDEPAGGTGTHAEATRLIRLMKEAVPQFRAGVTATYANVSEVDTDLFNQMDVIIANLPKITSNSALLDYYKKLTNAEGKSLGAYVASDGGHARSPANYFRRLGWEAERLGLDSAGIWTAVRSDNSNSWDDFSAAGRYELLLAETGTADATPTKMLSAMREGAEDYAYFRGIRQTADKVRDLGVTRALGWWAKRATKTELNTVFASLPSANDGFWKRNAPVNSAFDRPNLLATLDVVDRFAPKDQMLLADDFGHSANLDSTRWTRFQPTAGAPQNVTDVDATLGVLRTRSGELALSAGSFNLNAGELTVTAQMLSQAANDGHVARVYNADRSQYLEMVYNDQGSSNDRVHLRRLGSGGVVQSTLVDTTLATNLSANPHWMAMNIDRQRVELSLLPHQQKTFSDFEGPRYTPGQSISGQDGWQVTSGSGRVTPDPVSGYDSRYTLQGDRSLVLSGQAKRAFDYANTSLADGTVISWRMSLDPGATAGMYFSDDLPAGSTPGGVQFANGNITAYAKLAPQAATGLIYREKAEYLVSMQLNFTTDRFSLWVETPDGDMLDASTSSYQFWKLLSASDMLDNGGIFLTATGAAVFDDIQITSPLGSTSPALLVYSGDHGLGGDLSGVRIGFGNELTSADAQALWDNIMVSQSAVSGTWNVDASGSWSLSSNWSGKVPNVPDATANFGTVITATRTVTVDSPQAVGAINFDSPVAYTIAGSNAITLDVSAGQAAINVLNGSHTIAAPVILADDTTMTVTPAGSMLSITGVLTATGKSITKAGAGKVQFENVRAAALNVDGGTVKISAKGTANSASGTSVLSSLSIASGATLDLANNSMIIDYTSVGTLVNDTRLELLNGLLMSSSATATKKLGYADNATAGLATFSGQVVDATSLLIKYTYGGDANLDGQVDISDLGRLATAWQTSNLWTSGDFNYDGFVDISDLGILATNWQLGLGSPLGPSVDEAVASIGLSGVSVPEPAIPTLAMLVVWPLKRWCGRRQRHPRSAISQRTRADHFH